MPWDDNPSTPNRLHSKTIPAAALQVTKKTQVTLQDEDIDLLPILFSDLAQNGQNLKSKYMYYGT